MPIGDRIRHYRELAGLTMEELAKKTGVQKSAINKYEKGIVTNIPINRVVLIAEALGIEPVALTEWERPVENSDELRERLHKSPGLRMLLSAADGLTEEDYAILAQMAERMNRE